MWREADNMRTVWTGWVVALAVMAGPSLAQLATGCPLAWETFNGQCYHFTFHPTQTYNLATTACTMDGAYLVSVNTDAEHEFISQWLTRHDMDRSKRWWTSGIGAGQQLMWEGDGTTSSLDQSDKWAEPGVQDLATRRIVYQFTTLTNTFLWSRVFPNETLPYICEISQLEAFRITQAARDHSYGTESSNPDEVPRGPRFTIQPNDVVVIGYMDSAYIECAANSDPPATYTWHKKTDGGTLVTITTAMDPRYSLTNGRFSFQNPQEQKDYGVYYCIAENLFGAIRSRSVLVSFGYLGEFSNDPPGPVRANQYSGTYIDCNPPRFNPMVSFQWYKGPGSNFLRTDLNTYQFSSYNGKLYFSEVQEMDAGLYNCVVILIAPLGQDTSTAQPPSVTSMGTELIIRGDTSTEFGPFIHNDFPAVFPIPPLRGKDLRVECFAYGRMPLYYFWSRDNGPIPSKAEVQEDGKVLYIPDAQLEDSGNYTCRVERGSSHASDTKSISIAIEALPFFVFPLRDQHVDIGSQFTLRCDAMAVPLPVYSWYKNGESLASTPGDVEVKGNVVVIKKADPARHNGMYQCSATNLYGTSFSSAQVRVLSFVPNFSKRPLDSSQMATVGGNTTIICQPEAAPRPEIKWSHNGRELALVPGTNDRVMMLDNGNLLISNAQTSDQGEYTCAATNSEGSAHSTGYLSVVTQTTITVRPVDTQVDVNSTAFLSCQASFDQRHHDLVYIWSFNGYHIDVDYDPYFRKSIDVGRTGLYIINAQFKHEGYYTCDAQTVDDKASASAYLTVKGPPSEPAGVYGKLEGVDVILTWSVGSSHGTPIIYFILEHMSNFNQEWRVKYDQLYVSEVVDALYPDKRSSRVTGLSPGSSFSFRLRAVNRYGIGDASIPSAYFKIPDAAPVKAPEGIMEMFSTVGTLAFMWTPMSPEDLTGHGVGYRVYWRLQDATVKDGLWQSDIINGRSSSYYTTVGYDHYYLPYEVKVAAFNYMGQGPNSTITVVMSAEDLPAVAPRNTHGIEYNGTAMWVYWDPLSPAREASRGKILGYQINYWWEPDPGYLMSFNAYCVAGKPCGDGLVIGLLPDSDYWFNVQGFSMAGLGPIGEDYRVSTLLHPPQHYTEYVAVHSHSESSVYVTWRGVKTYRAEEPLTGYKLRWWPATEKMVSANFTMINSRRTWGVIEGVKPGIVYALRVLGYSVGGDGKNSPTVYFTLEGQVVYNPATTEILATGSHVTASIWTVAFAIIMCWVRVMC